MGNGKKILIIDDEENVVATLNLLLTNFGFEPINSEPITTKEQAICMVNHYRPDVILLDHNLGNCNGLDIAKEIKNKNNLNILSTSISVTSSKELSEEYRKTGVKHFPGKNFLEIKKCLEKNCACYLPLVSFLP